MPAHSARALWEAGANTSASTMARAFVFVAFAIVGILVAVHLGQLLASQTGVPALYWGSLLAALAAIGAFIGTDLVLPRRTSARGRLDSSQVLIHPP